jgi:hypothetical protein
MHEKVLVHGADTLNLEVVQCSASNICRVFVHDTEVVFNRDWCETENMHTR